jgi:putative DNA primase/helicase
MPKIREYTSKAGYYLQTTLSGKPITLQVSPEAEALIEDLEFDAGDELAREVLKPLILLGEVDTKSESTDKVDLYKQTPAIRNQPNDLQDWQIATLREYLKDRIEELVTDYALLKEHLNEESTVFREQWNIREPSDSKSVQEPEDTQSAKDREGALPDELASVPTAIREHDQWIGWEIQMRDDGPQKMPIQADTGGPARVNDPETWVSFSTALESWKANDVEGVGFVFTADDVIAGVDLDGIRDPETGALDDAARDIVERLDSYTEVSPSGTGVHVLVKGFKPPGRNRHGDVEMYDRSRYFTVTGDHLEQTPTSIEVRQDALRSVHMEYVGRDSGPQTAESGESDLSDVEANDGVDLPERIQPDEILERAKRNDKFERLWRGDHAEYPSQSEADMALCCSLAYRTGGDIQLMDELFRQSGLMRPKWDEDRGDQTYGELTLQKAVQFVDDVDPYLTEEAVEIQTLSEIDPRETATVEVEVVATEDPSGEKRAQTGRVTDDTRALRYVRWDAEDGPTPELVVGERYRLENVWVKTFDGRKEIQINEHTTIEKLSD